MSLRPHGPGAAPRLLAAVVGAAAVVAALQSGGAAPSRDETAPVVALSSPPPPVAVPPAQGSGWLLRSGGWFIRVDGAEIELPPLSPPEAEAIPSPLASNASRFDALIISNALQHGFDWRLIAALIYEESGFKPESRSPKGAVGLMQVRPIAAEQIGMERFEAPADNIEAGVKYLRHLDHMFDQARGDDRLGLILAAYNMGPAHVRDAQWLAQYYGYDPNRWRLSMDRILPLLEEPIIHKALPAGYAQGRATVSYVERVLKRFRQYQREKADVADVTADALSSSPGRFGSG